MAKPKHVKVTVILGEEEFARFDAYCRERAYKKSTLISRLIRQFLDLEGFHHRPTGSVGANRVRICFRNGAEDYYLGYDLLFEMGKSLRYVAERPYILGTFLRLSGYFWQVMTASGHALPKDLIRTVRRQKWSGVIDKIRMKTGMTSRVYSERRY